MAEAPNYKRIIFNVILGILVLVWSFYILDRGFYMDEAGLLSLYKGIYQGNRMFVDSWGPFQLGGLITYPLFALYYNVLEPILTPLGFGFVIYMRACYQVIRLLIAVYLYYCIRKTKYASNAFVVALTYYAFFVSFKNISYKSMCDFGIILFLCFAARYYDTRNKFYFVLMGLATCLTIMAYPSMIVFPIVLVICMLIMSYRGYELVMPVAIYSVTCFAIGAVVLVYLQLTSGLENILPQLQYLEDSAYKYPAYVRLGMMLLSYVVFFIIAVVPILVMKLFARFRYVSDHAMQIVLSIYWIVFMIAVIALRPGSVSTSRFIYGCLIIFFWYPFLINNEEKSEYIRIGQYKLPEYDSRHMLKFMFFISALVQMIWAFSTNQEVTVPGHMSIYVVLALLMIADEEYAGLKLLKAAVVALVLFFMGFWVAEGDGGYSDILKSRTYVSYGAYQGIALNETDYQMDAACYDLMTKYITEDDKLFALYGYSNSAYLNTDAIQAAGSPYSRAGIDQNRVLEYWQVNPERTPDYILLDTSNKYYEEYLQGATAAYINENYTTTVATEGTFILLTR